MDKINQFVFPGSDEEIKDIIKLSTDLISIIITDVINNNIY